MERKVSGFFGKLGVLKTQVIDRVKSVKENVLLIGSGITAIGIMFVIASLFIDYLGFYVGMIIGALLVTEVINFFNGNKENSEC